MSWQQQYTVLLWRYSIIRHCRQSQCKCRQCKMPDILHHHRFLYFSFTSPMLPHPVLLQGFLQLAGPQSASQEQPGDRDTTTGLLQQQSQTQAINTAGEHLIIYFLPESTLWQNNMARCHERQPETTPSAHPANHMLPIFRHTSAFFLVFAFVLLSAFSI